MLGLCRTTHQGPGGEGAFDAPNSLNRSTTLVGRLRAWRPQTDPLGSRRTEASAANFNAP